MSLLLTAVVRTDVGRVRRRNEDAWLLDLEHGLAVVADGMGGHPAGDVASRLAVAQVREALLAGGPLPEPPRAAAPGTAAITLTQTSSRSPLGARMSEAADSAGRRIYEEAVAQPARKGMGTTLTALLIRPADGALALAHAGDSRAYLFAGGRLVQLTTDHTWVQERVDEGALTAEEARTHAWSHVLTRCLTTEAEVPADVLEGWARPGDLFLLCSDGLTTMVPDADLERILEDVRPEGLEACAAALVSAALQQGGVDNVTVALLEVQRGAHEGALQGA